MFSPVQMGGVRQKMVLMENYLFHTNFYIVPIPRNRKLIFLYNGYLSFEIYYFIIAKNIKIEVPQVTPALFPVQQKEI
jgi:hypothetical protein